ncbi:BA75_00376T0 [Komagataella pastoris]|uniref:BA75_00376T0 n=1 Tax=Komagataella pastoris TaxID=4922 RepID=A0A1B2J5T3_PICPA|nr:BA75_00376T0 [Komagataella pastoris]
MSVITPQRLVHLSTQYKSLTDSWFLISIVALNICNLPEEIPKVYHYALELYANNGSPTIQTAERSLKTCQALIDRRTVSLEFQHDTDLTRQKHVTSRVREALLKSAALGGLPKCINSMMLLKEATPLSLRETAVKRDFLLSEEAVKAERERGRQFWNSVYGKISNRVMGQMNTAYPDLWQYTFNHVYAPLLSFTDVLSIKETSLVVISCLIPQDVNPQLKGHLKGAVNNGCTLEEIRDARLLTIQLSNWCGVKWKGEVASL